MRYQVPRLGKTGSHSHLDLIASVFMKKLRERLFNGNKLEDYVGV